MLVNVVLFRGVYYVCEWIRDGSVKSEPTEKGPNSALRCLWLRFNFLWVYDKVLWTRRMFIFLEILKVYFSMLLLPHKRLKDP